MKEHVFRTRVTWEGADGVGTRDYRSYRRDGTIEADGPPPIPASSDRAFRGDPSRWNPEQLLVAALSECHLLSYLHVCVEAGAVVLSYVDEATGTMTMEGDGGGRFTEVVLRPTVGVADASMVDAARAAHERAHHLCFIARSVNFPVRYEAQVEVVQAVEP